jgi:hypothetical protein
MLFFENVMCGRCGHRLAYLPDLEVIGSLDAAPRGTESAAQVWTSPIPRAKGKSYRLCENYTKHNACNWAIPGEETGLFCRSCRLTRVVPDLSDPARKAAWVRSEAAKRRLVYTLLQLGLPLAPQLSVGDGGLAFEFLADPPNGPRVLTGHKNGVITLNIDEADDVQREARRLSMHEKYRTLLGHFRHEIGHYYWDRLVAKSGDINAFRASFGDERADYAKALNEYYAKGPAPDWSSRCVTEYASMHPWEDWAETWAHYLHMIDTLEMAAHCGLTLRPDRPDDPTMEKMPTKRPEYWRFEEIISNWFPLSYLMNGLNRTMGSPDVYPFTLTSPVIDKLRFVHDVVGRATTEAAPPESMPK